jgi:hypothetical protein
MTPLESAHESAVPAPVMELPGWGYRNSVTATMLNPALIAAVLAAAAERFETRSGELMPWEYSFLVAPLVFHRDTRRSLPNRADSHMTKWVKDNPVLLAGFPDRSLEMVPYVREGLRFGLHTDALTLDSNGRMQGRVLGGKKVKSSLELAEFISKSGFVGSWLTTADRPASVFALLGVAP